MILTIKMEETVRRRQLKTCSKCDEKKDFFDFYMRGDFSYKNICKQCEIEKSKNRSKKLWECEECNIIIREANQGKHLKSHRHLMNRFWGEQYDYSHLQPQNKRQSETQKLGILTNH